MYLCNFSIKQSMCWHLVHWIELCISCHFSNCQEVTYTLLPGEIPTQECSHPRSLINDIDNDYDGDDGDANKWSLFQFYIVKTDCQDFS